MEVGCQPSDALSKLVLGGCWGAARANEPPEERQAIACESYGELLYRLGWDRLGYFGTGFSDFRAQATLG